MKETFRQDIPIELNGMNVEGELLRRFPELDTRVRQQFEKDWDFEVERPGNYLVFQDVVFPFLKEIAGKQDEEQTARELFNFFEQMATSADPTVRDLLGIAITEQLAWDKELLAKLDRFVGPNTRQMIDRDSKFFAERRTETK